MSRKKNQKKKSNIKRKRSFRKKRSKTGGDFKSMKRKISQKASKIKHKIIDGVHHVLDPIAQNVKDLGKHLLRFPSKARKNIKKLYEKGYHVSIEPIKNHKGEIGYHVLTKGGVVVAFVLGTTGMILTGAGAFAVAAPFVLAATVLPGALMAKALIRKDRMQKEQSDKIMNMKKECKSIQSKMDELLYTQYEQDFPYVDIVALEKRIVDSIKKSEDAMKLEYNRGRDGQWINFCRNNINKLINLKDRIKRFKSMGKERKDISDKKVKGWAKNPETYWKIRSEEEKFRKRNLKELNYKKELAEEAANTTKLEPHRPYSSFTGIDGGRRKSRKKRSSKKRKQSRKKNRKRSRKRY